MIEHGEQTQADLHEPSPNGSRSSRASLERLGKEILERCDELALHSEHPEHLTRTFLSHPMRGAHQLLEFWMRDAGLNVRVDALGNMIGRLEGASPKTLMIGSHIDTVPNAGKYDGMLGVLTGIAMAKAISVAGLSQTPHSPTAHSLPFSLEVIAFSEEEGVRFATPFLGSRAVVGRFTPDLLEKKDQNGIGLDQAIRDFGLDPDQIAQAAYDKQDLLGYLEVHIEQGPVLESLKLPLGAVEAIMGQTRVSLRINGQASHAGTTPMHLRKDALVAASEMVLETERYAKATKGLVATVGVFEVSPGAGNVIPGEVRLSLDVRHANNKIRERAAAEILDFAWHVAQRRKLKFEIEMRLEQDAAPMDELWTDFLCDALKDTDHKAHRLTSGAGHDAMILAPFTRTAMLFVRSPKGLSHHPDESVLKTDVKAALEVALEFVHKLKGYVERVPAALKRG
jgi:allantoate deiminase